MNPTQESLKKSPEKPAANLPKDSPKDSPTIPPRIQAKIQAQIPPQTLAANLEKALERVESARLKYDSHHIVRVLAASKYVGADEIAALYAAGQRGFGENRVQDLRTKSRDLAHLPLDWHFIGTLQENKINALLDIKPSLFHALDSIDLALALEKRLAARNQSLDCLLEIHTSGEATKSGVSAPTAEEIYCEILEIAPHIKLRGVMTMAAHTDDLREIDACFRTARGVFERLVPLGASIFSAGMSGDFEIAIANGANLLRLGSVLFKN